MTALPEQSGMSVDEYFRMDRDDTNAHCEYIDGYVAMLELGSV